MPTARAADALERGIQPADERDAMDIDETRKEKADQEAHNAAAQAAAGAQQPFAQRAQVRRQRRREARAIDRDLLPPLVEPWTDERQAGDPRRRPRRADLQPMPEQSNQRG